MNVVSVDVASREDESRADSIQATKKTLYAPEYRNTLDRKGRAIQFHWQNYFLPVN
jgi:hypothetical protein